ncbi:MULTISPECIES: shikimate dehydrogenase [unclassified Duganella]|uniref:shikimate dehydrogenase n=1 Tax=unclassified Duganella TaxID=2636909 RepID=UPI000E348932|nr:MULTISPECIES: shikimate dehydrogenase [unclassified Duganella]RFP12042.1 shikimate dehydrogenase [Duganella sp. BJB475]RFP29947.1 shikimate dehydrogenase [Duganella sp. BJB476]
MDRYCVFGNPIAHSKSPEIHAAFAAQTGQELSYEKRLAPVDGFAAAVQAFIAEGGKGANVTVPFKLDAVKVAQALTIRARAAGAVNTLHFTEDGIVGDNTDGAGLVADIVNNAGVQIIGKRVLLLGAGGAARGVVLPILEHRPAQLVIANRTVATAEALVEQFAALGGEGVVSACGYGKIEGAFDIVINATSASLSAELPPVPASVFAPGSLAYDMMYGASPTVFLQFAGQHGARLRDGLGMLVEQAAEAFSLWRGVQPATAEVLQSLRAKL